jgi:hypothetical protein
MLSCDGFDVVLVCSRVVDYSLCYRLLRIPAY